MRPTRERGPAAERARAGRAARSAPLPRARLVRGQALRLHRARGRAEPFRGALLLGAWPPLRREPRRRENAHSGGGAARGARLHSARRPLRRRPALAAQAAAHASRRQVRRRGRRRRRAGGSKVRPTSPGPGSGRDGPPRAHSHRRTRIPRSDLSRAPRRLPRHHRNLRLTAAEGPGPNVSHMPLMPAPRGRFSMRSERTARSATPNARRRTPPTRLPTPTRARAPPGFPHSSASARRPAD